MRTVVISNRPVDERRFSFLEPLFVYDCRENSKEFIAGRLRNYGSELIDDDILFLDGDRYPTCNIVDEIYTMSNHYDAILFGVENDARKWINDGCGLIPFLEFRRDIMDPNNGVFSCGIWISKNFVKKLRKLNNGRIFDEDFCGAWGEEDRFLGDQLMYLGAKIGYTSKVKLSGETSDWKLHENEFVRNYELRFKKKMELFNGYLQD